MKKIVCVILLCISLCCIGYVKTKIFIKALKKECKFFAPSYSKKEKIIQNIGTVTLLIALLLFKSIL